MCWRTLWLFVLTLALLAIFPASQNFATPMSLQGRDMGQPTPRSAELSDTGAGPLTTPRVRYDRTFAPVIEGPDSDGRQQARTGPDGLATASGFVRLSRLHDSPHFFRAALETSIQEDDVALALFGTMPMDAVRSALQDAGVTPLGEVPNNALVVTGIDGRAAASLARSGATLLAWTPAFFVSPEIGVSPVLDADRAVNPNLRMQASLFPGTDQGLVVSTLESMGASLRHSYNGIIAFTIDIDDLRQGLHRLVGLPVRAMVEEPLIYSADEDTNSGVELGRFRGGDRPYNQAGIDGSTQIIGITDTGLSIDAAVFADRSTAAGTPGPGHRKVVAYIPAQDVPGSGGVGDLESCDGISGATHGHLVASIAAANASELIPDIRLVSGFDSPAYFSRSFTPHGLDGVAAGARVFFIDDQVSAQCTEPDQMDTQNPGTLSASTNASKAGGAWIHNFSLALDNSEASYELISQDLDAWLAANTGSLVVVAAGNSGTDANGDGNLDFGTVTAPGTAKNVLTVGSSGYPNNTVNPDDAWFNGVPNNGIGMVARFAGGRGSGQGPAAVTQTADGGNNWRIKPDVMAPGDEVGRNQRMVSPTTCISTDNTSLGSDVECNPPAEGERSGTSFSAAAVSGAAALVRDYYAKGFAPGGATSLSGVELKAHLIASADLMTGNSYWDSFGANRKLGFYTPRHLSTFTPEQGYGRIQLNKLLPLSSEPGTPSYLQSELVTLPLAATISRSFTVVNAEEELRCVASWYDKEATLAGPGREGNLVRNIDMVVRECGAACGDADDVVYHGNFFSEDSNYDNSLLRIEGEFACSNDPGSLCEPSLFDPVADCGDGDATCDLLVEPITEDCNVNGFLDFSEFSLPVAQGSVLACSNGFSFCDKDAPDPAADCGDPAATCLSKALPLCRGQAVDVNNTNEAVFLAPNQLRQGGRIQVHLTWAGSTEGDPPPSVQAGLVCSGGLASASSPDSVRMNKAAFSCADALQVTAISPGGSTPDAIAGDVTVTSIAADGVTVLDSESGLSFASTDGYIFNSTAIAVVDAASTPPADQDLLLGVESGGHVTVTFGAVTSTATIRCAPQLTLRSNWRRGTDAKFNIRGGCDPVGRIDPRAVVQGLIIGVGDNVNGDLFLDANEDLTYKVAFRNEEEGNPLLDVQATLKACSAGSIEAATGACAEDTGVVILDPVQSLGLIPPGEVQQANFHLHVGADVRFPDQIEMVFTVSAAKNGLSAANRMIFHHTLNTDMWSLPHEDPAISGASYYSTDFPTGGREVRVVAGEFYDPLNPDLLAEEWIFQDMTDASAGGGNSILLGFNSTTGAFDMPLANNMPWTFDLDDEAWGARRRFDSDAGDNLELESRHVWQWNNTGECGFQSNDAGQPDFGEGGIDNKGVGGIWHTGHAQSMTGTPPGRTGYDLGCEDYDLPGSSDPKRERVLESVGSPIFFRVHQNADPNGFAYTLEFTRLAFNVQADFADNNAYANFGLDPDTTTAQPVDPLNYGGWGGLWSNFLSPDNAWDTPSTYQAFNPNDPHDPTSARAAGLMLDETPGSGRNIREIHGPGSPGSFYDAIGNDPNKAPARSFGEITGFLTGRGMSRSDKRGAGGFPVRNYDAELADIWAATFEDYNGPNETRDPEQTYPISITNPEVLVNRRSSFQVNFLISLRENQNASVPALPSYGVGFDDVVVEWREVHPMADRTPCSDPSTWARGSNDEGRMPLGGPTTCIGGTNGGLPCTGNSQCPGSTCTASLASGCAVISWDKMNIFSSEDTLTLTVMDTNAQYGPDGISGTGDEQAVDSNGDGYAEITVAVSSTDDPVGELMVLEQTELAGAVYQGTITVSATKGLISSSDNTLFAASGADISAQYTDQDINVAGPGQPAVPCPDNPLVAVTGGGSSGSDISFVTATIRDVGANADGDLLADPGEEVEMEIVLINSILDLQGEKVDLEDVTVTLMVNALDVGADRPVACVLAAESFIGAMPSGQPVSTAAGDPLRWVVGNISRTSVSQVLQARFTLGIRGRYTDSLGIEHTVQSFAIPQRFEVNLDLDIMPGGGSSLTSDAACVGGSNAGQACFTSGDCPAGVCDALPAYLAEGGSSLLAGKVGYFEGFEGAANMAGRNFNGSPIPGTSFVHAPALNAAGGYLDGGALDTFQPGPLTPGATPGNNFDIPEGSSAVDGIRCQYKDPRGPGKFLRSEYACRPWDGSDWHVNDTKAFNGQMSLYGGISGRYDLGLDDSYDTYHLGALSAAFSGTFNVGIAGGATLSMSHIVSSADDRTFNAWRNTAYDRALLEWAEVDPASGTPVGAWRKINGFQNTYSNTAVGNESDRLCIFENYDTYYDASAALGLTPGFNPGITSPVGVPYNADGISSEDDYFDPNDPLRMFGPSSSCKPEFIFSSLGDWTSTDVNDAGDAFTKGERGSVGNGIWVKSLFSLDAAAGRTIRLRFVFTGVEYVYGARGADLFGNTLGNAMRGWRMDDIAISGLVDAPTMLTVDTRPPGVPACPVDPDSSTPANENACGSVSASAGSDVLTPVSGSTVTLDASGSFADQCVNGHLEYQWRIGGNLMRRFSTDPILVDTPLQTTEYTLDVRCSTDPLCTGSDAVLVLPGDQLEMSGTPGSLLAATLAACSNDPGVACDPEMFDGSADCGDAGATCVPGLHFVATEAAVGGPCDLTLLRTGLAGAGDTLRELTVSGSPGDLAGALKADLCSLSAMTAATSLPGRHGVAVPPPMAQGEVEGFIAAGVCQGVAGSLGRLKALAQPGETGRGRVNPGALPGC